MKNRNLRIHGDNIIECERSLMLLSAALNKEPQFVSQSSTYMPKYKLGDFYVELLSGHGRWGVDIAQVLANKGGILREGADSYVTEVKDNTETILFALEYCSALPAGNNAWQRSGRALSCALAGVPYLYMAEIGGIELDADRKVKAPRFPNPVVPFSYLMFAKKTKTLCIPVYTAHPSITEALYKKYENVFGINECHLIIKGILFNEDCTQVKELLAQKALNMVKLLADGRRHEDTIRGDLWDKLLSAPNSANWFQNSLPRLKWSKKTADKVKTTKSFNELLKKVLSYECNTVGAKDLPICIIPQSKRDDFDAYLSKSYPKITFNLDKEKPLAIVWITGFKPRGDDSRPDRGLSPLAKMLVGNDAQLMAIVYGPAYKNTWELFIQSPRKLAYENGLWQSIMQLCDYVLVDSETSKKALFYTTHSKLTYNKEAISFDYQKPNIAFTEHDTDTTIHQLFSRKEHINIYECLCNPPGGDWSGISYFTDVNIEYRWTSLPRVSAVGGKRPDHVIQIRNKKNDIILSVESKLKGYNLENNIGDSLKSYLDDLFKNTPNAWRTANKDWRRFEGKELVMRPYEIVSVGAYEYTSDDDMQSQLDRGHLDIVFAFKFSKTTILHILCKQHVQFIIKLLSDIQKDIGSLKVQIH